MQFVLTSVEDNALRFEHWKFMQSVLNYMLLVIVGHIQNKYLVLHKKAIFSRDAMRGRELRKRKNDAGVRISTLVECVFRLLYKYLWHRLNLHFKKALHCQESSIYLSFFLSFCFFSDTETRKFIKFLLNLACVKLQCVFLWKWLTEVELFYERRR